MNKIRSFVPLGVPPSANKLMGIPSNFAVSSRAQILAASRTNQEAIISAGRFNQTSVIDNEDPLSGKSWILKNNILLARNERESVISAPRGLFRVDIDHGSHFICEPSRLVGTIGTIKANTVYSESRLDVLRAWTRLMLHSSSAFLIRVGQTINLWSSKLSRIPLPERVQSISWPQFSLPKIPESVVKYWSIVRTRTTSGYRYLTAKTFYMTHPRKLKIEGPCSILIKA